MELNLTITVADMPLLLQAINNLAGALPFAPTLVAPPVSQPAQFQQMPQQAAPVQPPSIPTQVNPAPPVTAAPSALPTSHVAQSYTQEQLAVAMTGLVDAGKQPQLMAILGRLNANSLMAVPVDQYSTLATMLREAGANI